MMDEDVTPSIPDVPGIDLPAYKRSLVERFANPKISDQLSRLRNRGSTKMPTFLLPSIREALEQGRSHEFLTLAVAGWFRYLRGVDYEGQAIEIKDARKDRLHDLAVAGGDDPRPLLSECDIFGDLAQSATFVASLEHALQVLENGGPLAAIDTYLDCHMPRAVVA